MSIRVFDKENDINQTLDMIGDNVWQHDFLTGYTRFADTIEALLGYQNGELVNKAELWWDITHPDDRYLLEANDIAYRSGKLDRHSIEYRVFHKDGSIRWIHDRGVITARSEEGMPLKIAGTHADITARKLLEKKIVESEKRFIDLARNVPGVIYQWQENYDGTFAFTFVSPKLKEYFNIEPKDMHRFVDYMHPDDVPRWRASVDFSKGTGSNWKCEGRLLYPDGTIKWWHAESIISEKNEQGLVYNGIITDITQYKSLQLVLDRKKETAKKQMLKAVINAQELERGYVYTELHDNVNQLLTEAKLLMSRIDCSDPAATGLLSQSVEHIERAIRGVKNISHDLNPAIPGAAGLPAAIGGFIHDINLSGHLSIAFDHSRWISSDAFDKDLELSVLRIIQAQVSNILKHSRASQAFIDLNNKREGLELIISDNGIGFDITQTKKGLGLANISNRAALFNGTVNIITKPKEGCKLIVIIPPLRH